MKMTSIVLALLAIVILACCANPAALAADLPEISATGAREAAPQRTEVLAGITYAVPADWTQEDKEDGRATYTLPETGAVLFVSARPLTAEQASHEDLPTQEILSWQQRLEEHGVGGDFDYTAFSAKRQWDAPAVLVRYAYNAYDGDNTFLLESQVYCFVYGDMLYRFELSRSNNLGASDIASLAKVLASLGAN